MTGPTADPTAESIPVPTVGRTAGSTAGPTAGSTAGSTAGLSVERIRREDWRELRDLRLEALADTPIAFLESLDEAGRLPDDVWQARAARGAAGGDSYQVLARRGGVAVGVVVGFLRGTQTAWLAAVYVRPAQRGQGVLERMVDPVARWAVERGATRLQLMVHEDNGRARAAYARLGFTDTGEREPYPPDPTAVELLLTRPL